MNGRLRSLRRRAMTLLEALVSMSLFVLLSVVLYEALRMGTNGLRTVDAQTDAQRALRLADSWLTEDLQQASPNFLNHKRISTSSGNGDVLWFLSAVDPTATAPNSQVVVRDTTGTGQALWQRSIIYYCIRPGNHDSLTGYPCAIDPNAQGDAYCPHKFLIRKVINLPASPEPMLTSAQIDSYTTAPNGYDLSGFAGEPGFESAKIISDRFLWFSVSQTAGQPIVTVDLRTVRVKEAERQLSVGNLDLTTSRFTLFHEVNMPLINLWQ